MDVHLVPNVVFATWLGGWEMTLILSVVLILLGNKKLFDFWKGFHQGTDEFLKATKNVIENVADKNQRESGVVYEAITPDSRTADFVFRTPFEQGSSLVLFIAQGFGVGWIPFTPGTFGSLVGMLWFGALLITGNLWFYLAGASLGVGFSVWACGKAERILKQKDPPSVVLDEIVAIPFCFLPWVVDEWFHKHALLSPEIFFSAQNWLVTVFIFILFRVFDVAKPWPVRRSQSLPGGWGVTADDLLAAAYVNVAEFLILWSKMLAR